MLKVLLNQSMNILLFVILGSMPSIATLKFAEVYNAELAVSAGHHVGLEIVRGG